MRTIKFRGVDAVTGKVVYGYYNPFLNAEQLPMIATAQGDVLIKDESLAQLIGVDVFNKEIYEGDMVLRIKDWDDERADYVEAKAFPMPAEFDDYTAIANGEIVRV